MPHARNPAQVRALKQKLPARSSRDPPERIMDEAVIARSCIGLSTSVDAARFLHAGRVASALLAMHAKCAAPRPVNTRTLGRLSPLDARPWRAYGKHGSGGHDQAMMTVFYDMAGTACSKRFQGTPSAIHFAVKLLQSNEGEPSKVVVRDVTGAVVFSEDEILNLSRQVRLV
jgi:hypothetical protein